MKSEIFEPQDYQKPQLKFDDILATIQTKIKIRIHESIMDRVIDYCPFEDFCPDRDERYIVNFPFIEKDYHYDILLGFGDKCECLEPQHIRRKMKRRIHDISKIYND